MGVIDCQTCVHVRQPPSAPRIAGFSDTAQDFAAQSELHREWQAAGQREDLEIDRGSPFIVPPRRHAWCARYTLIEAEVDEIARRAALGDATLADKAAEAGLVIADAVSGFARVYAICQIQNLRRDCAGYEAAP